MGLEGAVKLGFKKELAAIDDPEQRKKRFNELVNMSYEIGKASSESVLILFCSHPDRGQHQELRAG
jgi:acetyl-CoA carboxylase carboxyltransferase component